MRCDDVASTLTGRHFDTIMPPGSLQNTKTLFSKTVNFSYCFPFSTVISGTTETPEAMTVCKVNGYTRIFCQHFSKGDNLSDFLSANLYNKTLSRLSILFKKRILPFKS